MTLAGRLVSWQVFGISYDFLAFWRNPGLAKIHLHMWVGCPRVPHSISSSVKPAFFFFEFGDFGSMITSKDYEAGSSGIAVKKRQISGLTNLTTTPMRIADYSKPFPSLDLNRAMP